MSRHHLRNPHAVNFSNLPKYGRLTRVLDNCLEPIMRFLAGDGNEAPQRTHFWNNIKLSKLAVWQLSEEKMVCVPDDPLALPRWKWHWIPIFHMPRFGGWKRYVVLKPDPSEAFIHSWRVGWLAEDVRGISLIQIPVVGDENDVLDGCVRVLRGPEECQFFGINESGQQIKIKIVDYGEIGDGKYPSVPLL